MEKYKCKRCSRTFSNGRALGGHMKSHLTNFPIPPKHKNDIIKQQPSSTETAAASWSSNSDDDEVEERNPSSSSAPPTADFDRDQENPRSRTSPAPDSDFLGVVLQDRESETETNRNPTRRRSKRSRKQRQYTGSKIESTPGKKVKRGGQGPVRSDSVTESIPVSTVSDGSMMITKEDEEVALSLMMLSLGKWDENDMMQGVNNRLYSPSSCKKVSELGSSSKSKELVVGEHNLHKHNNRATVTVTATTTTRRREIVKKTIPEEASEGDRSVDLKFGKVITEATTIKFRSDNVGGKSGGNVKKTKKIYECPYCNKVFESGQALGGHKRSHLLYGRVSTVIVGPSIAKEVEVAACGGGVDGSSSSSAAVNACSSSSKRDESGGWIDLNLPAPLEEDSNDHALKPVIF